MPPVPKLILGRRVGSRCCRAALASATLATAGRAKASGIGLVGSPALAAYLSNHPEHLLRNITAELKLGAMGRRFDPLNSRRIERTAQEVSEFVPT
jgi:hypothetical protein